jgi:hypothetical protein
MCFSLKQNKTWHTSSLSCLTNTVSVNNLPINIKKSTVLFADDTNTPVTAEYEYVLQRKVEDLQMNYNYGFTQTLL